MKLAFVITCLIALCLGACDFNQGVTDARYVGTYKKGAKYVTKVELKLVVISQELPSTLVAADDIQQTDRIIGSLPAGTLVEFSHGLFETGINYREVILIGRTTWKGDSIKVMLNSVSIGRDRPDNNQNYFDGPDERYLRLHVN